MDASPIDCIFTVSRATARTTAYLRCRRPRGHRIHCKYAVDLFCERPRGRRSEDGIFSLSWAALWCPQGPQKVVEQISEIQKVVKWRMHSKPRPDHFIFTMDRDTSIGSRRRPTRPRRAAQKVLQGKHKNHKKMRNRKSRWMHGSNPFCFTSVSDAPIRIHCKTEMKIALPPNEGRLTHLLWPPKSLAPPRARLLETKQRDTTKREANLIGF